MTSPEPTDLCWEIDPGCLGEQWDDLDPEVQDRAVGLATASLYRLTLGQVGGCEVTVRPCPVSRIADFDVTWLRFMFPQGGWGPQITPTGWVNCGCFTACGCTTGCEIDLPGYVGPVSEIKVGGVVLDTGSYRVLDHARIVWQGDPPCPFPRRQDLSAPAGGPDTFTVTYLPARPVDASAAWAAGVLAAEFAKACTGTGKCRLPNNVVSISRQGVSMTLVSGAFPDGKTGLREVDAWVALWNPTGDGSVPLVWSPDVAQAVTET